MKKDRYDPLMMNHQHPDRSPAFDVDVIRRQFTLLSEQAHGLPLIYLDNAATTQKPESVIQALTTYYQCRNANVHRAAHFLSARATHAFEDAREQVRRFLNAGAAEEIIWTRGTTEAINLVASSWGQSQLKTGDEILVSRLEHHANIVPWQLLASSTGAVIKVIELDEIGRIDLEHFQRQLSDRTRLVAITQASNAIGTLTPLTTIINTAHDAGALVLVDGAQAAAHCPMDVQALGCDFYVFSGHKAYGPTGIGVLYGRRALLEAMPPWQGGGEMIEKVSFSGTRFNRLPFKFEAGTPHIAGAIGLAQGLSFIQSMDSEALILHERQLLSQAEEGLAAIKGVKVMGGALKEGVEKAPMVSFISEALHNQDIGMMLDQQGIAVRTGHHCAMPLMESFNLQGTVRASFAAYNNPADVSAFILALERLHHPGFHQVTDVYSVPDISGVVDRP
ncbi:MAG: aminotransferase class V-fold PLP-dependent enzyme, partial [Endozoicomonas sp.]